MTKNEYAERIMNWLSSKYEYFEGSLEDYPTNSPIRIANGARCDLICDIIDYMVHVRDLDSRNAR